MREIDDFKFPGKKSELENRISVWSVELGLPVSWLQNYIASSVLTAMLGRARDAKGQPLFLVKGGAAMLIRFGTNARATRDFDSTFRGLVEEIDQALKIAFQLPLWNFTAHMKELDPLAEGRLHVRIYRYQISFKYLGDAFNKIRLELTLNQDSESEPITAVLDLSPVRLPKPTDLELLKITRQIAEKWHACTEPDREGVTNDRVSDVYDLLLLLRAIEEPSTMSEVVRECEVLFGERKIHDWPVKISSRNGWTAVWEKLYRELPMEALLIPSHINEAIAQVNDLLFQDF